MLCSNIFKARSANQTGFTLLEMLIVLLLLSLGYSSLSSTLFQHEQKEATSEAQSIVEQSRQLLHYARELAIAKGAPIAIELTENSLSIADETGNIIRNPADRSRDYVVESPSRSFSSAFNVRSGEIVSNFYFDSVGRPVSRVDNSAAWQPMKFPIQIALEGYENDSSDTIVTINDSSFLLISNVTGELITL